MYFGLVSLLSLHFLCVIPAGQIALVSGKEQEDRMVSVIDLKSHVRKLIGRGQRDSNPVWSPDGSRLAFESYEDGVKIFTVNADGTEMRPLPSSDAWNRWPAWSPDGKRLAYVGSDGTVQTQVIKVFSFESQQEFRWGGNVPEGQIRPPMFKPVWLGKSLLVALLQAKLQELSPERLAGWSTVDPDPANTILSIGLLGRPGALTTGIFVAMPLQLLLLPDEVMPSRGNYAEWSVVPSPNGKWVAFESNDGGDREIFVLSSKGAYNVTNHRAADWNPVWSPKGDRFCFESFRTGRRGLYIAMPDTAQVRPLVVLRDADCWSPTWSPEGKWVAYISNWTGNPELWLVQVSTCETAQITADGKENLSPAWRPERRR